VSRALPNARGHGPPPRAYRDAGTPHGSAAIRFVDYMLGLAALLILHCRQTGSYPETGLEEINGDLPEADFWPGITSGLSVSLGNDRRMT
jgi:hypothetical protein